MPVFQDLRFNTKQEYQLKLLLFFFVQVGRHALIDMRYLLLIRPTISKTSLIILFIFLPLKPPTCFGCRNTEIYILFNKIKFTVRFSLIDRDFIGTTGVLADFLIVKAFSDLRSSEILLIWVRTRKT